LEESPLQVLNVGISISLKVLEIDQFKVRTSKSRAFFSQNRFPLLRNARHQRIERAGKLPARFCDFRKQRSLGFADL
jgi:hypothetical protein